ncbi:MAG TPA: 5'-methylthioadenosine/adenosylhomocysteine nucleosidase [Eubacteriales bacterium]|nr:5'-methylthioadenosine/adenosylhomocysteine nucleosidase [Clostridia bacterium]HRV72694.1 5'-methylthioadenosine/adenosylhomocysteine nucleosidase [Eubacteriales bacterium]
MFKRFGIICAVDDELAPFLTELDERSVSTHAMVKYHEGLIHGLEAVCVVCGVGRVHSATAAQTLIDTYGCDAILNSGTAGALDTRLKVLDVAVAETSVYSDLQMSFLVDFFPHMKEPLFRSDDKLLALARSAAADVKERVFFGKIATGEFFTNDSNRGAVIARHDPLCADMETAAIAHVCYLFGVPFIAVRSMTDEANVGADYDFMVNVVSASQNAAELSMRIIAAAKRTGDVSYIGEPPFGHLI